MKFSDSYQVKLSEIPLINLRQSFDNYYQYIVSDSVKLSLDKPLLHFETDFGLSWSRRTNSFISSIYSLQYMVLNHTYVELYLAKH